MKSLNYNPLAGIAPQPVRLRTRLPEYDGRVLFFVFVSFVRTGFA